MNGNAIVFVGLVVGVILVVGVGVTALIVGMFVLIFRANTTRYRLAIEDAVERWAEEEGYEVISSKQVDRRSGHPFRDRFGVRIRNRGDYGGVVLRIVVEDREGQERSGWLYMPLKGQGGIRFGSGVAVYADWRNAEVVWDRRSRLESRLSAARSAG
jgi:hypothetical protein